MVSACWWRLLVLVVLMCVLRNCNEHTHVLTPSLPGKLEGGLLLPAG